MQEVARARLDGLDLVLDRKLCLVFGSYHISDPQTGRLFNGLQAGSNSLFGPVLELVDVGGGRVEVLLCLVLPAPPLLCECWGVFLLDVGVVFAQVRGEVWVEDVQADDERERRREHADRECAVARKDATSKRGNADIEQPRREWFRSGDERLDFVFDRALQRDPPVNERPN